MKQSAARIGALLLLTGAALAVLVLLLWSGGGERSARAYPGLTVGIDTDPSTTTDTNGDGLYESVDLATFEYCRDASVGEQFNIDVFVLDVWDLIAFSADLEYDSSTVNVIGVDTDLFLGAQPGSNVVDTSGPIPPAVPGRYEVGAFDEQNQGDDGSGVLARLTLQAVSAGVGSFNIDTDPIFYRGVTLKDINNVSLGDIDSDGFYDGPYINANSIIAVDQPDSNGNGISDVCEPDDDGDGICNPGVTHPACTGSDNCPNDYNPGQEDIDGDGLGDVCDVDKDGDGFTNDEETARGSAADNPSRTPEVCDNPATDEDGDGTFNEGYDYLPLPNGNGVPDCTENVDTDGDTTPNPSDADDDNDGFNDDKENWVATNSLDRCANTTTSNDEWDDKWPVDGDDNRTVNILDVLKFKPAFNSSAGDIAWRRRYDLDKSNAINILDILKLKPHFNSVCVP